MPTLTYTGELVTVTCWCGMAHAVPKALREHQERQHRDGRNIDVYCPLGHTYIIAGTPAVDVERRARKQAEARANALSDQLTMANREAKRIAKRAKQGVCPCCHRSFVNVKRHMDSRHPGYEA